MNYLLLLLFFIFLTVGCGENKSETANGKTPVITNNQVELSNDTPDSPILDNPDYILNTIELPEWMVDPMLIEVLPDGRIMVIGHSHSDSIAIISPDLEDVEGYSFEGGLGTITAVRAEASSVYVLLILMFNKYDIRTGNRQDVFGSLANYTYWAFDYRFGMFLTIGTLNNEVFLEWINSAGAVIQTVKDPLRLEGDGNPMVLVPNGVALDSNRNGWVTNGANDLVYIYSMTGQLLTTFHNIYVPVCIRRYGDKMVVGSGQHFRVLDLNGEQVQSGMFPEYVIDFAFTANGNVVAIARSGVIHLMDIPSLYDYRERPVIR